MEPRVGRTAYRPLVAVITCHTMKIINLDASRLATYVRTQVEHFFPMGEDAQLRLIDAHLDEALGRLGSSTCCIPRSTVFFCITWPTPSGVRSRPERFAPSYLH